MSRPAHTSGRRLWGVAAFFNPLGSARRAENYRVFRQHLQVPLVTVELAYGPDFELGTDDADIMLRLRGRDVLWQKERLLNLALRALPVECDSVAWLDADIVFERPDWPELALAALEHSTLVQPFRDVRDQPGENSGRAIPSRQSLAFRVSEGALAPAAIAAARLANAWRCAAGLAWVARREVLDLHGLYDAGIVGGGDRAIACAAYGAWQGLPHAHRMSRAQEEHYVSWARSFAGSVGGRVGFAEGCVSTLAHGTFNGRAYGARHAGLEAFAFDPAVDLAIDEQGCWRWNSDRPALHDYVKGYFDRRDD